MLILNVAAGKQQPLEIEEAPICHNIPKLILNIDKMYRNFTSPFEIEKNIDSWIKDGTQTERLYLPYDIGQFLECSRHKFDRVAIYRYLEHVPFVQVPYFIYLISTITMKDSFVDVIVPDYKKLAKMIFDDDPDSKDFIANNILLTTELLNEPNCPHASIWTGARLHYYWTLEKRFLAVSIKPFEYDGRDIYLRAILKRI